MRDEVKVGHTSAIASIGHEAASWLTIHLIALRFLFVAPSALGAEVDLTNIQGAVLHQSIE